MQDSIFTKIVAGEIPCHKVYEDEMTLAFLDIYPKMPGHTLVIPKLRPTEFVWDLEPDVYDAVMQTARKVALRLRDELEYSHVHEAVVGTDVPYAHVHLIPFNSSSDLHSRPDMDTEPDHEKFAALAEKLRFS